MNCHMAFFVLVVRERFFDGRRKKAVFAGRRYGTWWKV